MIEDRWITNPMFGPWGFETPRAVQHDGKVYMFAMYFYGLQYTVGDDPFHFGPWHVVGPWHAPVIFNDDEERWYITHSMNPFGKLTTIGSKAGHGGVCISQGWSGAKGSRYRWTCAP